MQLNKQLQKTLLTLLLLSVFQAQAKGEPQECEELLADAAAGASYTASNMPFLDCSATDLSDLHYQGQITQVYPEKNATRDHMVGSQPLSAFSEYSADLLEQKYSITSVAGMPPQFVASKVIPSLPNKTLEESEQLINFDQCPFEYHQGWLWRAFSIRQWTYTESKATNRKAWLLTACGKARPATLFIEQPNSEGERNLITKAVPELSQIESEFTHHGGSIQNFLKLHFAEQADALLLTSAQDNNYEAPQIEDSDSFSSSSSSFSGLIISQMNALVMKNNQTYALPVQKYMGHDYPRAQISGNGNLVAIATDKTIKLFEYQPKQNSFKLAGFYEYEETNSGLDNFRLSFDGRKIIFPTHILTFTPNPN
jgi:hypothetical protein